MNFSVEDFFALEPREFSQIITRRSQQLQNEHRLQYIATVNAIGQMFAENYDYVDVFDKSNEGANMVAKDVYTDEEQQELLEYFSNW